MKLYDLLQHKSFLEVSFNILYSNEEPYIIKQEILSILINYTNISTSNENSEENSNRIIQTLNQFSFFARLRTLLQDGTWIPPSFLGI